MEIADRALIYKARNSVEARALAAHLGNADIDAHVTGDVVDNVFGVPNLGAVGAEVWVRSENRDVAEALIAAWRQEHGGPAIAVDEKPQFALKTLFKATAVVAVIAATSRLFGADLRGFVTAASLWFYCWLIYLSARAMLRRRSQRDLGDSP